MSCHYPLISSSTSYQKGCRCKGCVTWKRLYSNANYLKNRDKLSKRVKAHKRQQKHDLILYRGGECHSCELKYNGVNAPMFDFHHPIPTGRTAETRVVTRPLADAMRESEKCYLLCANCHRVCHAHDYGV